MKIYLFLLYSISPFRIQKVSGSKGAQGRFCRFPMLSSVAGYIFLLFWGIVLYMHGHGRCAP
jgi:hypothetical protein